MHQRKSKKILLYFFLLIVFSSISNYSLNDLKLNQIQNINISGLEQKDKKILFDKLKTLSKENIFLINKNESDAYDISKKLLLDELKKKCKDYIEPLVHNRI